MPTVTLDSDFEVYADVDTADAYMDAAFHGANWRSADDDTKARALVTATRILDRQRWRGEKTDEDQALQWPRTGTGIDGVEDSVVPDPIIWASIELALILINGGDVQDVANNSQKIQSLGAGSARISYFRGAEGRPVRFPQIVQELVRDYLAGSARMVASTIATGTSGESVTDEDFGYSQGL